MFFIYKSTSLIINTVYGLYCALSRFLGAGVEVGSLVGKVEEHALVLVLGLPGAHLGGIKYKIYGPPSCAWPWSSAP